MLVLFGIIDIVVRILLGTVPCALLYPRTLQNRDINYNWLYHKCVKVFKNFRAHVVTELWWIFRRNSNEILMELCQKSVCDRILSQYSVRITNTNRVLGHNSSQSDACDLKLWSSSTTIVVKICDGLRHNIPVTNAQKPHSCTIDLHSCDGLFCHTVHHNARYKPNVVVAKFVTIVFWPSSFPSQLSITNYCDGYISVTNIPSQWNLWPIKFLQTNFCHKFSHNNWISITISEYLRHNWRLFL